MVSLIMVVFSRIYFGAHSINQCYIGVLFGVQSFLFIKMYRDNFLKHILLPIFKKLRYKNQNSIALILLLIIVTNYSKFVSWAYVFTIYEQPIISKKRIDFKNCYFCISDPVTISKNFSSKTLFEILLVNFYFGMLLGIYLSRERSFSFKGLFFDNSILKFFLRVLVLFICMGSIMIFILYPKINSRQGELINFARCLSFSFLAGIFFMSYYRHLLIILNLNKEAKEEYKIEKMDSKKELDYELETPRINIRNVDKFNSPFN